MPSLRYGLIMLFYGATVASAEVAQYTLLCQDSYEHVGTATNILGQLQTCLDSYQHIWTSTNMLGQQPTFQELPTLLPGPVALVMSINTDISQLNVVKTSSSIICIVHVLLLRNFFFQNTFKGPYPYLALFIFKQIEWKPNCFPPSSTAEVSPAFYLLATKTP